jgi:hypothetical protein
MEMMRNKKIDRKNRKKLIMYEMQLFKAYINRLYIKWKEGKRWLLQIEKTHKAEIMSIAKRLNTKYKEGLVVSILKTKKGINQIGIQELNEK